MAKDALLPAPIADLDLSRIRQKLLERGWSEKKYEAEEADYRRFLALFTRFPGETFVPCCDDMDEVWHTHILDTAKYMRDCAALFGRYIHHDPVLPKGTAPQRTAWEHTKRRYAELFCAA